MKQTVLPYNADGVEKRNDLSIRLVVYSIPTHFYRNILLISRIKENSNPLVMAMYSLLS